MNPNDQPLSLYTFKMMNKGSGVLNLSMVREKLMKDYINYIESQIKYEIFYYKQKQQYIFTFKIPSESNYKYIKPFYYDVIFCFDPMNEGQAQADHTLNSYYLTVFSNCPSFIFNYTYVYMKNLISWIPRKYYSPLALKQPPNVRNFYQIKSYEKSLYTSYLHVILNRLFDKNVIKDRAIPILGYASIFKKFCSQDDKLIEKKMFEREFKIKDMNKIKVSKEKFDRLVKSATPEKQEKINFLSGNA